MTIKHQAFVTIQRFAKPFGIWIDKYEHQPIAQRQRLLELNNIDHVIDVGAHEGEYVAELRSGGYCGLVTSFEPLPGACERLVRRAAKDTRWRVEQWALAEVTGRKTFRVSENEVSSSLLEIQRAHLDAAPASMVVEEIDVDARRLDDLSTSIDGSSLLLKLDVQGAEALVLGGAVEFLQRVNLLEMELGIVELYRGQLTLIEMLTLVEGLGFVLALPMRGFLDQRTGRCLQMNGIFARS